MTTDLTTKAAELWPGNATYQAQWIRMVQILRAGRGWVLEGASVNWRGMRA